jgi:cytochrome P450
MSSMLAIGLIPIVQWPPIARLLGPSEKDKSGFGKIQASARARIDARLSKSMEGRSDMLASFSRHGLTKDELFTESMLQLIAGSDTTATALRSTMLYLLTHPRVYFALQAEIDETVKSGAAGTAPDVASDACLRNLPYLQAVVREGLRIHPPISDIVPKLVPAGGDTVTVNGRQYFFPGGTNIGYDVWGVHHSKAMFGEDANAFRPERWLLEEKNDSGVARLAAMRRTTELIFGYGKYQCLGKPVAWMEITKVLFEVSCILCALTVH